MPRKSTAKKMPIQTEMPLDLPPAKPVVKKSAPKAPAAKKSVKKAVKTAAPAQAAQAPMQAATAPGAGNAPAGKTAAQRQRDKRSKSGVAQRKRFETVKAKVFEMERGNNCRLIAFVSRNNWYKFGGRSAMIFHYRIAKRLGRKTRLLADTDFFSKFNEGVVSIASIDKLEEELKTLKIYRNSKLTLPGAIYTFELGYTIEEDDIRRMYNDEKIRREKVNQMVVPKVVLPDLHTEIWEAFKICYRRHAKMPLVDREALGQEMVALTKEMVEGHFLLTNNYSEQTQALGQILLAEERLKLRVKMVMELELWPIETTQRLAEILVKIERLTRKTLKVADDKTADVNEVKRETARMVRR